MPALKPWKDRRIAVAAVLATALFVGIAFLILTENRLLFGDPVARARAAYLAKDWTNAERLADRALSKSPDDEAARLILSRSLGREGKAEPALAAFQFVPVNTLESEDALLIAQSMLGVGRPVLAWIAFDAAVKLDPKNREASVANIEFQSHREKLEINERQAELLTSSDNGFALLQIAIGLFKLEPKPSAFDPLLDRLLERDRKTLSQLDNSDDARKLIARILLEEGRPADARSWLTGLVDPESKWLLSRASLDLDDFQAANREVDEAGGFGEKRLMSFEPCRYVGAFECSGCHSQIYKDQQSSRHSQTLVRADALDIVPLPKQPVKDPFHPDAIHEFDREGKSVKVRTRIGEETFQAVVAYGIGSAHHGQTLLAREPSGTYRSLRISYYTGGDHWDITSGFDPHPKTSHQYLGEALNEESYRACIDCHSTRFRSDRNPVGPEALDRGIGCEKCHGPGENHVKALKGGFPELAIARPKEASPQERAKLCARCHSSDGSIPQSDIKFVRFQSTTLPFSRCVTESKGALDCVACHDPHKNLETNASFYEERCLECHSSDKSSERSHFQVLASTICKVNPKNDCLKCHMPKVEGMLPFTAFTDHHIRIHRASNE